MGTDVTTHHHGEDQCYSGVGFDVTVPYHGEDYCYSDVTAPYNGGDYCYWSFQNVFALVLTHFQNPKRE